jgi:hypothetical protein
MMSLRPIGTVLIGTVEWLGWTPSLFRDDKYGWNIRIHTVRDWQTQCDALHNGAVDVATDSESGDLVVRVILTDMEAGTFLHRLSIGDGYFLEDWRDRDDERDTESRMPPPDVQTSEDEYDDGDPV